MCSFHGHENQGAFHVKPTLKVHQVLSFCMPGIFGEREATKKSEYSNSDDFRKLSVLAQICQGAFHALRPEDLWHISDFLLA